MPDLARSMHSHEAHPGALVYTAPSSATPAIKAPFAAAPFAAGARVAAAPHPAPPMGLGAMEDVAGDALLSAWEDTLTRQTRLFGPLEVEWLRANGFAGDVLEVGAAAGRFGSFLARSFPAARLHGVEASPAFVAAARDLPANYTIRACVLGRDPLPAALAGRVDQAFLRYVLQHVSDPARVLAAVHDALPEGGRVFVVEEDDAWFTTTGECPAFSGAADAWRRLCRATGTDSTIGRKLPALLGDAGFEVERYEIVLRTSSTLGPEFYGFFSSVVELFHHIRPDVISAGEARALRAGLARRAQDVASGVVATYPHVLAVARKAARVH